MTTPSNPAAGPKRSVRNGAIEGLRGIAAFLVVISHINGIAREGKKFAPPWQIWLDTQAMRYIGVFGVCAFFCISGYLIVQSLLKSQDVRVFAINRVKRIYPLFLVLQIPAFVLAIFLKEGRPPRPPAESTTPLPPPELWPLLQIGANVLAVLALVWLIDSMIVREGEPRPAADSRLGRQITTGLVLMTVVVVAVAALWTKSPPASFYAESRVSLADYRSEPAMLVVHFVSNLLFLPGVFELPIAQSNAWTLSFEAVFYLASCLVFLAFRGTTASKRAVFALTAIAIIAGMLLFRPYAWFFVVGVACYYYQTRYPEAPTWARLAPVGLVAVVLSYLVLPEYSREGYGPGTGWLWVPVMFASFVFFQTLVYQTGWLAQGLQWSPLQYLGKISYSLYLVHPFVLHPASLVADRLPNSIAPYVFIVVAIPMSILVSHFTFLWFETWLAERMFPRPARPSVATASGGNPPGGNIGQL